MKRLALAFLLASVGLAQAQQFSMPPPQGVTVMGVTVVTTCGTQSLVTGSRPGFLSMDVTGKLCTNATGGGGGGAVTIADGADQALGTTTDAACGSDTLTCTLIALMKRNNQNLTAINTSVQGSIPAGTAIIGTVGIDQTTPGTTNGVKINAALPAGTAIIGKTGIDQTTPGTTNGVQVNAALPAGANLIGKTGIDQTTPGTTNGVQVNAALPAGANLVGKVGIDQTTPGTTNGVQINAAVPAGANVIGKTTTDQTTPGTTDLVHAKVCDETTSTTCATVKAASTPAVDTDKALVVAQRPSSMYHVLPAASDNHVVIKNGSGNVFMVNVGANATLVGYNYIRLYDAGTGFNGCNSATNIIWGMPVQAPGIAITLAGSKGIGFTNGLSICFTGAYGDTDTTNATASASSVNVSYK